MTRTNCGLLNYKERSRKFISNSNNSVFFGHTRWKCIRIGNCSRVSGSVKVRHFVMLTNLVVLNNFIGISNSFKTIFCTHFCWCSYKWEKTFINHTIKHETITKMQNLMFDHHQKQRQAIVWKNSKFHNNTAHYENKAASNHLLCFALCPLSLPIATNFLVGPN